MEKRGALGLPLEMLVIIIISLVVLGAGIVLLYNFVAGAESLKAQLDAQTDAELERLLVSEGARVALPLHQVTLHGGENHVFGIGILNVGTTGNNQFTLEVGLSKVINEQEQVVLVPEDQKAEILSWLMYNSALMIIQENEHRKEPILVSIPEEAMKGTYIFAAMVKNGETAYGNVQKFTVKVS